MRFLLLMILSCQTSAFAALDIKPGLWSLTTKMKREGKEMDHMAQMQKSMAKMSPEQKKKMTEIMGQAGAGIGSGGEIQVCFTKDQFAKPETTVSEQFKKCDSKIMTNTSTKMVMTFTCKDGATGEMTFAAPDPKVYTGTMLMKSSKGVASEISYNGKYIAAECGVVKPFQALLSPKK
jgi:hypothetical protein